MTPQHRPSYFPHVIQISAHHWRTLELGALSELISRRRIPRIIFFRQLAQKLNRSRSSDLLPVHASHLDLFATLQSVLRYLIDVVAEGQSPGLLSAALKRSGSDTEAPAFLQTAGRFIDLFPPAEFLSGAPDATEWLRQEGQAHERRRTVARELLLLRLAAENPAVDSFREILDDTPLVSGASEYPRLVEGMFASLARGPRLQGLDMTLTEALLAPIKASPGSLAGQIGYIKEQWQALLPPELLEELVMSLDILLEEEREREWGGGPAGPPPVLEFGPGRLQAGAAAGGSSVFGGYDYPEYERFSADADWMSNVVLMAKMVYVWLDQLSRQYGYPISRLDQVPDAELDRLAAAGFTGLWLIGVWERSPASQRIKQLCGNPDAIASAYSLYDYEIAQDLGGWEALGNLRQRALQRGIRLASDMVPNHTGIYSRWVVQHPDWFVQTDYPPFPTYQFNGEDLSHAADAVIQVEDGYWTRTDAAVVFRLIERQTGRVRYIYHGNDGTSIPWNDTAQLNYLMPEVREAAIQTILHVARNFPIIRFDAAMTLAKKHYQRLWFPIRGLGGGIPSRAEHGMTREEFDALFPVEFWREVVDRVAVEAPGTLLLAEAFWMMEGYFVRTLGMHRVYNSAFMNMLKMEENAKYRQTIKNVLEFNHEVLKRFVNFMNNPDEKTAVEQFGTQGKYFGACVLMVTMPGLPMFGHGQLEGFHEKYGMEYKRAYWNEPVDQGLLRGHELWIFPLLRQRWLFSDSRNFVLYDFFAGASVDENVFAYSNRVGSHRALILYHNRYDSTAGWIRESAPYVTRGDDGGSEILRTDLAGALGLTAEAGVYYGVREMLSGLEFIRSGRELAEKGLYAELGEYQACVFVDFREIRDDDEHSWSNLCASLNGRGVPSLEVERRQVRYASLNAAYRVLLEHLVAGADDHSALAAGDGVFARALQRFLSLRNAEAAGVAADCVHCQESTMAALALLSTVLESSGRNRDSRNTLALLRPLVESGAGVCLLVTWMLLRKHPDDLASYGLDHTLQEFLRSLDSGDDQPCLLLEALLSLPLENTTTCSERVAAAFVLPSCGRFLMLHQSEGIEWFNKERFESFVQWLMVLALVGLAPRRPASRVVDTFLAAAGREAQHLVDFAAHAGYRKALFLQLIAPMHSSDDSDATGVGGEEPKPPAAPYQARTPGNKPR